MDSSYFITYDATSMMIFVRALKLQDAILQFIHEYIYSDINLTESEKQNKDLLAKIIYLEIQCAPDDVQ